MSPWNPAVDHSDDLRGPASGRSYWVRVPGHAAQVLDAHGWIIESLGANGQVRPCSNFDQQPVKQFMALKDLSELLPRLTGSEALERIAREIVSDVWGPGFAVAGQEVQDALVKLARGHLDAELGAREDHEFGQTAGPCGHATTTSDELEEHAVSLGVDGKPTLDRFESRVDNGVVGDQGAVPVDPQKSHKSSPSVGAPNGAGVGASQPADGEPLPGAAASSPAAAAPVPNPSLEQE